MSEIMLELAKHYRLGISILSGLLISVYLLISILAIRKAYSSKGIVPISGMIPLVQLKHFISPKKEKVKSSISNTHINDIDAIFDDEILDDIF